MPPSYPQEPVTDVPALPARPPATHKGEAGRVAIVAGSRGMSGAAFLSGYGALRGGAGLVRVYTPVSVQPIIAAGEPCLMTVGLPEDADGRLEPRAAVETLRHDREWPSAVAIGPGLGCSAALGAFVRALLGQFAGPLVLDADGLNSLGLTDPEPAWWTLRAGRTTVLTPHPGEMARVRKYARLAARDAQDEGTRRAVACEMALLTRAVTVLKGAGTVVASAERVYVNTTGNPGMATPGMGDVLTGLLAALLGQGLSGFDAARLAVYAHGHAADQAARRVAPVGYLAREVGDLLPAALAHASRPAMGFQAG